MAPGAKRKSFDHALASFPVPGGGGAAAGGVGGLDAWVLEGREGRRRCPLPRSRRRRGLESDAAIFASLPLRFHPFADKDSIDYCIFTGGG